MRRFAGNRVLIGLGALCAVVGFGSWVVLAWKAFSGIDEVQAESVEGGRLLSWALVGTLLMISSAVLFHIAETEED